VPSWNGVKPDALAQIVDTILSGTKTPEKVDKESLVRVLSGARSSKLVPPVTYQSEVYKVLNEEFEKMMLGSQDLDKTLETMKQRVQQLIDANKKG